MKIAFINYYPKPMQNSVNGGENHSLELLIKPLVRYLSSHKVEIEVVNLDTLSINPCEGCTEDINFEPTPCCAHINDDMNSLYPILRESEIWIFAISLNNKSIPKKVYNFIDRLEPLFNSSDNTFELSLTDLTLARNNGKVFLLSTSEHWGKEVFEEISNQIQSVSLLFSKEYFGEILRPHFGVFASRMESDIEFNNAMNLALSSLANDIINQKKISNGYLEKISDNLISKSEFDNHIEKLLEKVI